MWCLVSFLPRRRLPSPLPPVQRQASFSGAPGKAPPPKNKGPLLLLQTQDRLSAALLPPRLQGEGGRGLHPGVLRRQWLLHQLIIPLLLFAGGLPRTEARSANRGTAPVAAHLSRVLPPVPPGGSPPGLFLYRPADAPAHGAPPTRSLAEKNVPPGVLAQADLAAPLGGPPPKVVPPLVGACAGSCYACAPPTSTPAPSFFGAKDAPGLEHVGFASSYDGQARSNWRPMDTDPVPSPSLFAIPLFG